MWNEIGGVHGARRGCTLVVAMGWRGHCLPSFESFAIYWEMVKALALELLGDAGTEITSFFYKNSFDLDIIVFFRLVII